MRAIKNSVPVCSRRHREEAESAFQDAFSESYTARNNPAYTNGIHSFDRVYLAMRAEGTRLDAVAVCKGRRSVLVGRWSTDFLPHSCRICPLDAFLEVSNVGVIALVYLLK